MKYTRQFVEMKGRFDAGIKDQTDEWYLVNILGRIPMYCRKDDGSVTPSLVNEGFWEAWITAWFMNEITEDSLFIDVGANTGYYSIIAKDLGSKVLAFEPNPKYVDMLRASVRIGWEPTRGDWTRVNTPNVYPWAVSDTVGQAVLTIPNSLQGSASIRDGINENVYPSDHITVLTTTLDRTLAGIPKQKTLIKIDAEGAEEMVWDGMSEVLYRQEPTIMLEYTPGAYSEHFLDKLESYSKLKWINFAGEEELVTREWILSQTDWIMLALRKRP